MQQLLLLRLSSLQDLMFTPQKGRSAPNSLEEERAEAAKASASETLKAAAAAFPPKRVSCLSCWMQVFEQFADGLSFM